MEDRTAMMDGDVLVYRSAFAAQTTVHHIVDEKDNIIHSFDKKREATEMLSFYFGEETLVIKSQVVPRDHDVALKYCARMVTESMNATKSDKVKCYLSGETNFRNEIATIKEYKGHRSDLEKPVHYQVVKDYILATYDTVVSDNCEADDLLATELYKGYLESLKTRNHDDCKVVCCTIDKDLRTVPGWHYNFNKPEVGLEWINNRDAYTFFWQQMLMGDIADNIPGIKGLGPVKSSKMLTPLNNQKEMFCLVAEQYEKQYKELWMESLVEIGRLLHMQRSPEDMWTPKVSWVEAYKESKNI